MFSLICFYSFSFSNSSDWKCIIVYYFIIYYCYCYFSYTVISVNKNVLYIFFNLFLELQHGLIFFLFSFWETDLCYKNWKRLVVVQFYVATIALPRQE